MAALDIDGWKTPPSKNGRIPLRDLTEIEPPGNEDKDLAGGTALMHPEAAFNYQRMRDEARAAGVILATSYSYRTFEVQQAKADAFENGTSSHIAAEPGTSNHGWGLALDLNIDRRSDTDFRPMPGDSTKRFNWLKENAVRFGFFNDDAESEPWHWDYEGGHPIEEAPMTPEEKAEFDEMRKTINKHEKLIGALLDGLSSEGKEATFAGAGGRVARSVVRTERAEDG